MVNKKKRIVHKARKPAKSKMVKPLKCSGAKTVKAKRRRGSPPTIKKASSALKSRELTLDKIGEVTHYFPHVNAAAVKLSRSGITVGDNIYIKGHTTDFKERVRSIQLDHVNMDEGKKGQEIGLYVKSRVRIGDSVYKI